MLNIAKVGRHRLDYYLGQTRAGGSADGFIEADGVFRGLLCESIGLLGTNVSSSALRALCEGIDPATGEILDPRHARVRNVAFDCTFAAPKSVSVAHALGQEQMSAEVQAAHQASVAEALSYFEQSAARMRIQRRESQVTIDCGGLGAAEFLHRVSRSLDPHLHSHVLVINLVRSGENYSALDSRALYEQLRAGGSLYRAHLRHELSQRLGVAWSDSERGFGDLIGLSRKALQAFSTRSNEIHDELERSGRHGRVAANYAAHATRPAKQRDIDYETLRDEWRERAFGLGVARSRIDELAHRPTVGDQSPLLPRQIAQQIADSFDRPFVRSELIARTASAAVDGSPASQLLAGVDELLRDEAVVLSDRSRMAFFRASSTSFPSGPALPRFVSHAARRREAELLERLSKATPFELSALDKDLSGRYVARFDSDERDGAIALARALSTGHGASRFPVVLLSAHERRAAHLESMSGILSLTLRDESSIRQGSVVVVDDAGSFEATQLTAFDETADRHRGVVYITRQDHAGTAMSQALADLDRRGGAPVFGRSGAVGVVVCSSPQQAIAALIAREIEARRGDRHVAVVSADPDSLACAGLKALRPQQIGAFCRQHLDAHVVVLGSARILGGSLLAMRDEQRTHVVVAPASLDAASRAAFLAGVGEPEALRRVIGRFPSNPAARDRWLDAQQRLEARQMTRDVAELSTDRTLLHARAFEMSR